MKALRQGDIIDTSLVRVELTIVVYFTAPGPREGAVVTGNNRGRSLSWDISRPEAFDGKLTVVHRVYKPVRFIVYIYILKKVVLITVDIFALVKTSKLQRWWDDTNNFVFICRWFCCIGYF